MTSLFPGPFTRLSSMRLETAIELLFICTTFWMSSSYLRYPSVQNGGGGLGGLHQVHLLLVHDELLPP